MMNLRKIALLLGLAIAALGGIVLLGWALDIAVLKSVFPGMLTMKANTAVCTLLCGAALAASALRRVTKPVRCATCVLALVVSALGMLTLSEYLFGWQLGIDKLLFQNVISTRTLQPGRMSPIAAACFLLAGVAILLVVQSTTSRLRQPAVTVLGATLGVIGAVALAGDVLEWVLGEQSLNYTGLAVQTSAGFVLLGIGLLALIRNEGGLKWSLTGSTTAGFALAATIMLVMAGVSFRFTGKLRQKDAWISHTQEVLKEIKGFTGEVMALESEQRGYIITGDQGLFERYSLAKASIHENLAEIRRLTADNRQQQRRLDQLEPLIAERISWAEQTIAAYRQNGLPAAQRMMMTGQGMVFSESIGSLLKTLEAEEYRLLKDREKESGETSITTFLLLPLGVLFGLTALSVGFFFLNAGVGERAQTERALQQSEARMAGIVASAMDAIISIDETQRIILFNTAAEKMFRLPAADVMGQPLDRLIPQRFRRQHSQHVEDFGKTGVHSWSMRSLRALSGLRADGEEFPVEASISQVKVAGQQIYTVMLRDVTERKRADEAAALLAAIVESSSDAIIGKDLNSNVTSWSAGAERMFGYTAGEMIGRSITLLIPSDHQDDEDRILAQNRLGERMEQFETVRMRKDGGLIDVSITVSPIRDSTGVIIGASKVARDITDRKQASATLGASEARYRTLFDYAPDGIVISNPESYYLDANASICRMLGYARDELIGLHASDIVVQSEIPHIEQALDVINGNSDYQREWQFRRKDGSVFAAEVIATKMPDGNLLGMIRDVTERKRAHATLREVEKEKELAFEASRLKSEFLANMSHELRTPLNCIIGFTEFLVDEKPGPLNAKQKEYLTDVHNSSIHLLQLINDVLDLAKVEAGKIDLNPETFPLAKAIEEVCAVVKGIAQKKGISVAVSVAPALGSVTLDQQKLKQVCYNLLANAVKFTDSGGAVEIHVLAREQDRFEVRVKDTGIGIRKENLGRLFREFEQLETGDARRFEGTGLGLALTKKLVESQGGSIGVESEYGSGSTFFVIMPTVVTEAKRT